MKRWILKECSSVVLLLLLVRDLPRRICFEAENDDENDTHSPV
jgi:hypothetical protein